MPAFVALSSWKNRLPFCLKILNQILWQSLARYCFYACLFWEQILPRIYFAPAFFMAEIEKIFSLIILSDVIVSSTDKQKWSMSLYLPSFTGICIFTVTSRCQQ